MTAIKTSIVADRSDFRTAHEKYLAYVEAVHQDGLELCDEVSGYTATEELSEIEAAIFGIELEDVPKLFWAYERYENLIGSMDSSFGEFTDQERIDHAEFFSGKLEWSFDQAVNFMVSVCGLPAQSCLGWVCKIVAANIRGGLYDPV